MNAKRGSMSVELNVESAWSEANKFVFISTNFSLSWNGISLISFIYFEM